jgi:hypothetical protein
VANTTTKVIYDCNIHLSGLAATVYGSDHRADIPVCLPAELNRSIASPEQLAVIDAMSPSAYDVAIAKYGDTVLAQFAALKAVDMNGSFCGAIQDARLSEFSNCKVKTGVVSAFCSIAANHTPKVCVPNDCHDLFKDGKINPYGCGCNTTVTNDDNCNMDGHTVVVPTPGSADPPGDTSGILAQRISLNRPGFPGGSQC